jgi:hypothetical protein
LRNLVISLLAGTAVVAATFGASGYASAAHSIPAAAVGHTHNVMARPVANRLVTATSRHERPHARTFSPLDLLRAHAQMTYTDLQLPIAVWSGMTGYQDGAMDATHPGPFKNAHSANYANIQGGFVQAATLDQAEYFYQGSYFSDAASAAAAFQDAMTTTSKWQGQASNCASDFNNLPCYLLVFPSSTTDVAIYQEVQVNYCLIEAQAQGSSTYFQANVNAISKQFATIMTTAVVQAAKVCTGTSPAQGGTTTGTSAGSTGGTTATPSPTSTTGTAQPSVAIDQVGLIHSVKGTAKQTTTLKSGEKGLFAALYHDANVGTAVPTGSISFTVKGTEVATLQLQAQTLSDGTLAMVGVDAFKVKKKAVHVTANFTITVAGATATQSLNFTVKPKKSKKK